MFSNYKNVLEQLMHWREHLKEAATRRKSDYDSRVRQKTFEIGTWVWMYYPRRYVGRLPKLGKAYTGPFLIIGTLPPSDYIQMLTCKSTKGSSCGPHTTQIIPLSQGMAPTSTNLVQVDVHLDNQGQVQGRRSMKACNQDAVPFTPRITTTLTRNSVTRAGPSVLNSSSTLTKFMVYDDPPTGQGHIITMAPFSEGNISTILQCKNQLTALTSAASRLSTGGLFTWNTSLNRPAADHTCTYVCHTVCCGWTK